MDKHKNIINIHVFYVESRKDSSANDEDMSKGLRASLKVLLPWPGDSVVVPSHISKGCWFRFLVRTHG